MTHALEQERRHLAQLLEAVQRSAYFLGHSERKIDWPLRGSELAEKRKDTDLFETLAAINERFAKLQDTLSVSMRHTALLMGEQADNFLKVLALFEKLGVLETAEQWQQGRVVRNIAAHDYETDYDVIAEHFNTLATLSQLLFETARRLIVRVEQDLGIRPQTDDFVQEFLSLFSAETAPGSNA